MHYTIMSQQTRQTEEGKLFDVFIIWLLNEGDAIYGYADDEGYSFSTDDVNTEYGRCDGGRWADEPDERDRYLPIVRSMLLQYIDNVDSDVVERWLA